ncbi:MAG: polysaccharide biosynthesis protein [Anaerolineae bacterium]|nr:polysaccharide biosynthesis protein [Anaerolineae bacterium]
MLKRLFDIVMSLSGLLLTSPLLLPVMLLVWLQDYHSPFYIASRVGRDGRTFMMIKLRSMVTGADKSKVDSTSASDPRITPIGKFIRAYKLDELTQLLNVLKGDMSLVGPRPNVKRETDLYTQAERELLSVRPGITDIASIVFSDEGDILKDSADPDLDYNQLIRPWKSRLGLIYVQHSSFLLDLKLIFLTAVAIVSQEKALNGVQKILNNLNADAMLKRVAQRKEPLKPYPPPGAKEIVTKRSYSLFQQPSVRPFRNRYYLTADLILIPLAVVISFALRFLEAEWAEHFQVVLIYAGMAILLKPLIFYFFGMYRRHWRYASAHDLLNITFVTFVAAAVVMVVVTSLVTLLVPLSRGIPRSIPLLDWLISTAFIGGVRFLPRLTWERPLGELVRHTLGVKPDSRSLRKRILIVGAGDAGAMVAREMRSNPHLGLEPVGFVDDNPAKIGILLRNLPVLGTSVDLPRLVKTHHIEVILIAMPTAPGRAIRQIVSLCNEAGVEYKTIPGIYELISGKVNVNYLRDIQIDDLLRRDPIKVDEPGISSYLTGKRVLITGAGGSIGSELTRQVARYNPAMLILVGHGENSIYAITQEVQGAFFDLEVQTQIADIRDAERIAWIFQRYRPQVVFHAAAHKHVPLMETNICEAVSNNVLGTQIVLQSAHQTRVERFVLISSDKAVQPINIMGATKRVAELLIQDLAQRRQVNFVAVRFGNVLGSRGSVVPLFQQQITLGGPITLTHPDMERFFMTIPEAVHLVIQAGALGQGGEIFVLDMGQPIKIVDLARDMIELSGLKPDEDIDLIFTGLRPGERLSEHLFSPTETIRPTTHSKILTINALADNDHLSLQQAIEELKNAVTKQDEAQIYAILNDLLPEAELQGIALSDKSVDRVVNL